MKRLFLILALLLVSASIVFWLRRPPVTTAGDLAVEPPPPPDNTNAVFSGWGQFRGPDQGRSSPEQSLPLVWSEKSNVVWKTEVHGSGVSSPVISKDKIWLTTATLEGRSLRVMAFAKSNGQVLLDQEIFDLPATPAKHAVNSYASPTPVLDKEHVFVAYGPYGIACLRASDGGILWENTELKFDDEKMGTGASPILAGDFVVIHCDGLDQRFIVALEKSTGKIAWKTPRSNPIPQPVPQAKSFSTPLLHEWNGLTQILSSSSFRLFGYEPASGRELWSVEIPGFCTVPVPIANNDWLYVCTGFNKAQIHAFQLTSTNRPPRPMWTSSRSAPLVPSPVLVNKHIYMIADNGIASCVDAATGKTVWNERIGGTYWASLLASPGRVYCFAQDGTTTVLAASPEFRVLAKNRLNGEIMATPAVADNALFLRTKTHLYRVQNHPSTPIRVTTADSPR